MSQLIQLASSAVEAPGGPPLEHGDPAIRTDTVYVVYTTVENTLTAVRVGATSRSRWAFR